MKTLLRNGATEAEIRDVISAAVRAKWIGHEINKQGFVAHPRPMYAIGG